MREELIKEIINHITNKESDINIQIIDIFNYVRDIPYWDIWSREPEDVYLKNKWTCSGKHELLKELLNYKWIETKECIIIHRFKDLLVNFPSEIKVILDQEDILDPHNLLKIKLNNKRIKVDCTRDKPMNQLWFPINENRDGTSDQQICVVSKEDIIETNNSIKYKEDYINWLSENQKTKRKEFLKKATEWIDNRRKTT